MTKFLKDSKVGVYLGNTSLSKEGIFVKDSKGVVAVVSEADWEKAGLYQGSRRVEDYRGTCKVEKLLLPVEFYE